MAQLAKHLPAIRRPEFNPWVRKIPWRRKWQPTPVLFPGKSHGQRSLVGYSPWGYKELGTTEQLSLSVDIIYIDTKKRSEKYFPKKEREISKSEHESLGVII